MKAIVITALTVSNMFTAGILYSFINGNVTHAKATEVYIDEIAKNG